MAVSVRLDAKTERLLLRLAKRRKLTKSEVIREALAALEQPGKADTRSQRPYDTVADLIGCVRGGPKHLSTQTGEKFRRFLLAKGVS